MSVSSCHLVSFWFHKELHFIQGVWVWLDATVQRQESCKDHYSCTLAERVTPSRTPTCFGSPNKLLDILKMGTVDRAVVPKKCTDGLFAIKIIFGKDKMW